MHNTCKSKKRVRRTRKKTGPAIESWVKLILLKLRELK
jgi:hypothetical protein